MSGTKQMSNLGVDVFLFLSRFIMVILALSCADK